MLQTSRYGRLAACLHEHASASLPLRGLAAVATGAAEGLPSRGSSCRGRLLLLRTRLSMLVWQAWVRVRTHKGRPTPFPFFPLQACDFGLSDFFKPDQRFSALIGSAYYVVSVQPLFHLQRLCCQPGCP